jgi:hypothetical protein
MGQAVGIAGLLIGCRNRRIDGMSAMKPFTAILVIALIRLMRTDLAPPVKEERSGLASLRKYFHLSAS